VWPARLEKDSRIGELVFDSKGRLHQRTEQDAGWERQWELEVDGKPLERRKRSYGYDVTPSVCLLPRCAKKRRNVVRIEIAVQLWTAVQQRALTGADQANGTLICRGQKPRTGRLRTLN